MSFRIVTDTSANLPSDYLEKEQIPVLPFTYYVDGAEATCLDTRTFAGSSFYDRIREGAKVTTSQITPFAFRKVFEPLLQAGEEILFVGMSSGISGSQHCAELAAEELWEEYSKGKLLLVDTLGASLGEGLLVMKAAECREQGMGLMEVYQLLLEMRHRICQIFTVDDLMYLRKGGRLSNAKAIVGTLLRIKPLLKGNEQGQIVTYGKCRGRKHAIEALAERYNEFVRNPEAQTVGIAHADCPEDADYLISLLKKEKPPKEILNVCYEPVTGSHVGPGTLALFFEAFEGVRAR